MLPGRPHVKTPRIVLDDVFVLDGPRLEDAASYRRLALDPEAARFLGWTLEQAESAPDSHYKDIVRRFIRGWEKGTQLSLAIRRRSDDVAVGMVELRPQPTEGKADVSYLVAAELRGRGLASRAVVELLDWGARELGLRQAVIHCDVENMGSQRVAEKCGFVFVGRFGRQVRFRRDVTPAEA